MTGAAPIRVMLVDDSAIVRGLMHRALEREPDIRVVATASNGLMAIDTLKREQVDVIILDIEMPEMDGLTALPKLLEKAPSARVIIVSSLTANNAEITMKALAQGALDCLGKPTARDEASTQAFYHLLISKVRGLMSYRPIPKPSVAVAAPASKPVIAPVTSGFPDAPVKALAIAASTGGPQALLALFEALKNTLPHIPIFITQHMPPTFTTILAGHLARVSGKPCREAKNGESVAAGTVYVAPGDFHMSVELLNHQAMMRLTQDPPVNYCRPSADPMLQSLARTYGKNLLTLVLTGMGHDGLEGCRAVVAAGGSVVAQDEQSSVVWGMPRAVAEDNLCRAVLPLKDIAAWVLTACGGRP